MYAWIYPANCGDFILRSHHHMFKTIMCKLVAATIPGHLSVLLWTMGSEMRTGSKLLLIMKLRKWLDEWLSLNDVQYRIPVWFHINVKWQPCFHAHHQAETPDPVNAIIIISLTHPWSVWYTDSLNFLSSWEPKISLNKFKYQFDLVSTRIQCLLQVDNVSRWPWFS